MKKLYAFLALALFAFGAKAQQIPNSGFEDWSNPFGLGEDPDSYISLDFLSDNVTKSTDAHSDSFSARLTTVYAPADTTVLTDSVGNPIDTTITENTTTGMLLIGAIDFSTLNFVPGIAFTGQPTALRFWVKGNVAADDTGAVIVGLTKYNSATSTSEDVGAAYGMILGNIPGWTMMEVPFAYDQTIAPDTMYVIITSTLNTAHGDADIYIDDLELVYTPSAVADVNNYNMLLFPNPSNGLVTINGRGALNGCNVSVSDVTGRVISNMIATSDNAQVTIANSGLYIVTATKPNGDVVLRKKVTVQ